MEDPGGMHFGVFSKASDMGALSPSRGFLSPRQPARTPVIL